MIAGRRTAVVLVLVWALGLLAAGSAVAHEQLIDSAPGDGEVLRAPPARVELTFSAEILALAPALLVRDEEGTVLLEAAPDVTGAVATAQLPADLGPGTYTVAWRVVSRDGHPIEGAFAFTIASSPVPSPGPGPGETPAPTLDPTPAASATPAAEEPIAPEPTADDAGASTALVAALAAAAVATIATVAVVVARRRRA